MTIAALLLAFATTTQAFNLPPGLLSALCYVETGHVVSAVNVNDGGSDSFGICQIKLNTAKELGFNGSESELRQPQTNIHYAGKYLSHHLYRYNGDIRKAVAAYNAGKHRENNEGLTLNRKYVSKVFKAWSEDK